MTKILSEWAQMTFSVAPALIPELQSTRLTKDIDLWEAEIDNHIWKPYQIPTDFIGGPTFPCLTATTEREKSKLIDIIHDATMLLHNTTGPRIFAEDLWTMYRRLLTWHEELPKEIGITGGKEVQILPHVLSLQ